MSHARRLLGPMRVPFLALTLVCVLLGIATAFHAQGRVAWPIALLAFVAALAAHVSVNALNEYLDFRSGLDLKTQKTPFSGGSGVLPADSSAAPLALAIAVIAFVVAAAIGLGLVATRATLLAPLGVVGLLLVVAYTSWITRHPLACLIAPGLGFGPLMVVGTHIALAGRYDPAAGVAALIPFFQVNALLLLNQFPDVDADREVGRRHLPIAWGRPRSARMFVALHVAAYLSLVGGVVAGVLPWPCLLGLATLALAIPAMLDVMRRPDDIASLLPAMGRNVVVNLLTPAIVAAALFAA
ncbi:MAG TPA: prenyltransferase [Casimicrobiaceae bacterium]|jgi:1,4-dihydroxy-2-naphthoate octaprenyltransferase|nr:prenyltransferase [Casimicrobiaceae bacterium]